MESQVETLEVTVLSQNGQIPQSGAVSLYSHGIDPTPSQILGRSVSRERVTLQFSAEPLGADGRGQTVKMEPIDSKTFYLFLQMKLRPRR